MLQRFPHLLCQVPHVGQHYTHHALHLRVLFVNDLLGERGAAVFGRVLLAAAAAAALLVVPALLVELLVVPAVFLLLVHLIFLLLCGMLPFAPVLVFLFLLVLWGGGSFLRFALLLAAAVAGYVEMHALFLGGLLVFWLLLTVLLLHLPRVYDDFVDSLEVFEACPEKQYLHAFHALLQTSRVRHAADQLVQLVHHRIADVVHAFAQIVEGTQHGAVELHRSLVPPQIPNWS
mmetsp:Transcript_80915/g.262048  ORF Transcript_80915/g.262048 Transcript_80915/m.262048 type:complete len:232 (+) Transcript_80915:149-844(+)